jgi:hypothetical protein
VRPGATGFQYGDGQAKLCVTNSLKHFEVEDCLHTTESSAVKPRSARGRGVKNQTVLTPEIRAFVDRAIVPALVSEYLAQERKINPVAPIPVSMDNCARTSPSVEETTL